MLPKKIVMENFGPFLHEEVDFEQMTEVPLFLISGKTGAGKTTIFDAITFALYGDASGGVRSSTEIRSAFAEPTEETRVQFLFEHQGRNYSIERWPKQTLAKKNGKGETTKNQKVQLSIFNDAGLEVEAYTKIDAVNEVIYQILHLQKDQFRQIVMLPQGEFRTFLNANSSEKESVLRSLFGTNFYRKFTDELKLQKQVLETEAGELSTRIDQLFQQIVAEKGATYEESLTFAKDYIVVKKQELVTEQQILKKKQTEEKAFRKQVQQAQELTERFQQMQETQQQLQQLTERLPEQEEKRRQLARIKKIEKIRPTYERFQEVEQLERQQTEALKETQKKVEEAEQHYLACQKKAADLDEKNREYQIKEKELQQLETLLPLVKQTEELQEQKAKLLVEKGLQQAHLDQITQQLTTCEDQHKILKERQNEENNWQERRYKELQFQQTINELQELAKQLFEQQEAEENQQIELAQLVEQASRTSKQLTNEMAKFKKLKSQWASAEIARLRMDLLPGEPCPVCGSTEHPDFSEHQGLSPEKFDQLQGALEKQETQIKQLELAREQAEARYHVTMETFDRLQNEREAAQNNLKRQTQHCQKEFEAYYQSAVGSELTELIQFLSERQVETAQSLTEINEAYQVMQALALEISAKQADKKQIEIKVNSIKEELQTLQGRLTGLAEQTLDWQLASLEIRMRELSDALKDYQNQWQTHQILLKETEEERIRLQEQSKSLAKQQQATARSLKNQQEQLQKQLGKAEIVIEELTMDFPDLAELEAEIVSFEQKLVVLKDRQERLAVMINDQQKPEIEPLQKLLVEKEAEVIQLQQQYYAKESHLQQQGELVETIDELQQQSKAQLDELSQMIQLFQTMNGDNPQKISLERYVLQWYLAEVLECANQQLYQLTKGRYRFELKQETGRSKGNTGLEINVYDDNAGATRSSHTLSGGESFIAALSLALGLAEVIQNQAGGVAIEALFIDEGFGSLDEEALEMAMEALEGIENAGRMIGIISHVRELKERIPQQIIVETSGTGSSSIRYQLEGWSET